MSSLLISIVVGPDVFGILRFSTDSEIIYKSVNYKYVCGISDFEGMVCCFMGIFYQIRPEVSVLREGAVDTSDGIGFGVSQAHESSAFSE